MQLILIQLEMAGVATRQEDVINYSENFGSIYPIT